MPFVGLAHSVTRQLSQAWLIYRGNGKPMVMEHGVRIRNGKAELTEGAPLTTIAVQSIARELGRWSKPALLGPNVLAKTDWMICWWTPPAKRRMFFRADSEAAELNQVELAHPALVWIATESTLTVRAMNCDKRPGPKTPLYRAPYWNMNAAGELCVGSMPIPDEPNPEAWERSFWMSEFTHANATTCRGGFLETWKAARQAFPQEALIPAKQNLEQFIGGDHC